MLLIVRYIDSLSYTNPLPQDAEVAAAVAALAPQARAETVTTAVHVLVLTKQYIQVETLLNHGAHQRDLETLGAEQLQGHPHAGAGSRLVLHIVAWQKLPDTRRDPALAASARRIVRSIIERSRTLIEVRDGRGQTALHVAAAAGNDEVVRMLLEAGASVLKSSGQPR
jgi:ankyrin repeat protein